MHACMLLLCYKIGYHNQAKNLNATHHTIMCICLFAIVIDRNRNELKFWFEIAKTETQILAKTLQKEKPKISDK